MKNIAMVIMVICAIGLYGCKEKENSNNQINTSVYVNSSGNEGQSNKNEGDKTESVVNPEIQVPPVIPDQSHVGADQRNPLSMVGWRAWNRVITPTATGNECTVNSNGRIPDAAGFANTSLSTSLRGRTLILYFSNTGESSFSQGRMAKLEYNIDDIPLIPTNIVSLVDEVFLPVEDTPPDRGIEFLIPNNFDGKLNIVFYQAELNYLRITAYYR
jgi:hypothetical protein